MFPCMIVYGDCKGMLLVLDWLMHILVVMSIIFINIDDDVCNCDCPADYDDGDLIAIVNVMGSLLFFISCIGDNRNSILATVVSFD